MKVCGGGVKKSEGKRGVKSRWCCVEMNLNNGLKGKELSKIVLNFLLLQMYYKVL